VVSQGGITLTIKYDFSLIFSVYTFFQAMKVCPLINPRRFDAHTNSEFLPAIVLCTMSSPNEKAKILQFVNESGSIVAAQRRFHLEINNLAPERHSIGR